MGVSVKVDYSNLPDGAEVEIPYLGVFENGSTAEVDDNKWERFLRLQPGARTAFEGQTSVEFSTKRAEQISEARSELNEAASGDGDKSLSDYNKDELVEMAKQAGVETEGLKKQQLIQAIEKSVGGQTIPNESQEG